jgi:uncharacterized protein YndB with AHSA1/START domain
MSQEEHGKAIFCRVEGQVRALMRRRFDHLTVSVWSMLTDPARLPQWLAPGVIELRPGGAVRLDFADSGTVVDSTITAYVPGRLLEYSWSGPGEPARPVRWELTPDAEGGTVLTLTLGVPEGEDAGRACAGWQAHLEMLEAALEGVPIKFPFETFKSWRDAYRTELAQA